jgi:hypothetical protein
MVGPYSLDGDTLVLRRELTDLDYVEMYAERLRKDNRLFAQQKMLIDSQMRASRSFFSSMLSGPDFKRQAREYLKKVGLL